MTPAPTRHTGPAEDTRRAHPAALAALRAAVARTAELWRRTPDPQARVPGLTWTAAETAAHVVGDLREHAAALTGDAGATELCTQGGSPSRHSAAVNAHHLAAIQERDMRRLADTLEDHAERYLAFAAGAEETADIVTPNGLVMTPPMITSVLLGEQLLHGLDVARAAREPWPISVSDALLVVPGVLALMPRYLRASVSDNLDVSYELRIRGGRRYRFTVRDGAADITAAGEKADCVITADPVAFLQLGYGRIPQWRPIIAGKMFASGRKPWLAAKFATLLSSP
jgi:hypothetical protein